jgi:hypothetical protein
MMRKALTVLLVGVGALAFAGVAMAENTLDVLPEAAMNGTNYGLKVMIDEGSLDEAYVQSDHPQAESHFRVSFWLDATNLNLPVVGSNKKFVFMKFYRDAPAPQQHTFVYIARNTSDTAWRIALVVRKDSEAFRYLGGWFLSNDGPPIQPQFIEIEYQQASALGANDGIARLWINGVQKCNVTNVQNSTWNVDMVRVGLPPGNKLGPLASGFFYFDEYVSTR